MALRWFNRDGKKLASHVRHNDYIMRINRNDPSLTEIDLADTSLTDDFAASLMLALAEHPQVAQQIAILNLSYNILKQQLDVTYLKNLEYLGLSNNEFFDGPILIGLRSLRTLVMSHNQLEIPPDLTGLVSLFDLRLDNNQLKIAPCLTGVNNLRNLILDSNQIKFAPDITGLDRLRVISIMNAPLTTASKIMLQSMRHLLNSQHLQIIYQAQIPEGMQLTSDILDEHFQHLLHIEPDEMFRYVKKIGAVHLLSCLPAELILMLTQMLLPPEIERANAGIDKYVDIFIRLPDEANIRMDTLISYRNHRYKEMVAVTENHYCGVFSSLKYVMNQRRVSERVCISPRERPRITNSVTLG